MRSEDESATVRPTSTAISPSPIRRLLGRWPWWSAEGKAQATGKMQYSERPFAKDARKNGWLEEASSPLGSVKPPRVPDHYKQTREPPLQAQSQARGLRSLEILRILLSSMEVLGGKNMILKRFAAVLFKESVTDTP